MIVDRDADGVRGLALAKDGRTLAAVDDAGWLRIWSLGAEPVLAGEGPTGLALPHAVAIGPGGVVVVGEGGGALFSAKAEPRGALPSFGQALQSTCFLPDGQRLLVTSDDGRLRLVELSGRVIAEADVGERNAGVVTDGKRFVVAASWQGGSELIVGELKGERLLVRTEPKITIAIDALSAPALNDAGTRALVPARELLLYELATGALVCAIDEGGARIDPKPGSILLEAFWSQAASMGGDQLAAASPAGGILVIDAKTGTIGRRFEGHPSGITALAGAPGMLASSGLDRTLRIWR